jgi:uncharacterized membrane protein YecN with MAPEG domain
MFHTLVDVVGLIMLIAGISTHQIGLRKQSAVLKSRGLLVTMMSCIILVFVLIYFK